MLSEREKQEIQRAIAEAHDKRGACIDALKIAQRSQGWVSDQALDELAGLLDMTPAELDNVATFYNRIYRRPVGRHVILMCNSVSCWIKGYGRLREHLHATLGIAPGETSADGRFTLLPNECLGICEHAPAMMVDEDLYVDVDEKRIDEALQKYR